MRKKPRTVLKRLLCYPLIASMCLTSVSTSTLTALAAQASAITSNETVSDSDDSSAQSTQNDVTVNTETTTSGSSGTETTSETDTGSENTGDADSSADVSSGNASAQESEATDWKSMTEDEIYAYTDSLEDEAEAEEILAAWQAYTEARLSGMDWREMEDWELEVYIDTLSENEYDAFMEEYEAYQLEQLSQKDWKTMTDAELETYKATLSEEELAALEAEMAAYYAQAEKYANYRYDEYLDITESTDVYGYDEDGNPIYYYYVGDVSKIIELAEDGMDLKTFFDGTIFVGFTLDDLYQLKGTGHTLSGLFLLYALGEELPDWAMDAFARGAEIVYGADAGIMLLDGEEGETESTTMTAVISANIDVYFRTSSIFGSSKQSTMYNQSLTNGSTTMKCFCLNHAGGFKNGDTYVETTDTYSETQKKKIAAIISIYEASPGSEMSNICQLFVWSIMAGVTSYPTSNSGISSLVKSITNEMYDMYAMDYDLIDSEDPEYDWVTDSTAIAFGDALYYCGISRSTAKTVLTDIMNLLAAGTYDQEIYDNMQVWICPSKSSNQPVVTWKKGSTIITEIPVDGQAYLPYLSSDYTEETATTTYNVSINKEAAITNESLEGILFDVYEKEADGNSEIDHAYYKGSNISNGETSYNYTTISNAFGSCTVEHDIVPYMDANLTPEVAGEHYTQLVTDVNGHAETTFTHSHTFKEFWTICHEYSGGEISKSEYDTRWDDAKSQVEAFAESAAETLDTNATAYANAGKTYDKDAAAATMVFTVYYFDGSSQTSQEFTAAETDAAIDFINSEYSAQSGSYTQTESEARDRINASVSAYNARTYTYEVTELDNYTRAEDKDGDSNKEALEEIELPKEGYRKDIHGVTTIGLYSQVIGNGATMQVGGTNDSAGEDENTDQFINVVDEPWYNRIFINKTDLETNNQILYDTEFEIYEYYSFKATAKGGTKTLNPATMLKTYASQNVSDFNVESITSATLKVTNEGATTTYQTYDLDLTKLLDAYNGGAAYTVDYAISAAGTYEVHLELTLASSAMKGSTSTTRSKIYEDASLVELTCTCTATCGTDIDADCPVCSYNSDLCDYNNASSATVYEIYIPTEFSLAITGYDDDTKEPVLENGSTVTCDSEASWNDDGSITTNTWYTVTATDGSTQTYYADEDNASLDEENMVFTYTDYGPSGIILYTEVGGATYKGKDSANTYVGMDQSTDAATGKTSITLYYVLGSLKDDGTYDYYETFSISTNQITYAERTNSSCDSVDYTTWGQDNYEIVRVTADIAKLMGWSDDTIGMYTVHRLSATDAYCGTTFSNTTDTQTGEDFGYYEYGTLYFTQANQGKFCIVETTAPHDGTDSGYLGDYDDREYTELSDASSEKNNDGDPYATDDEIAEKVVKPHYITLCVDTNQYATYMLIDGYENYSGEAFLEFADTVTYQDADGNDVTINTVDGYDAALYDQSALKASIALEHYLTTNDTTVEDVLNGYWDNKLEEIVRKDSGLTINRHSDKTDTFMKLLQIVQPLSLNYVGSTINVNSYKSTNNSARSNLSYHGSYVKGTVKNYQSYIGDSLTSALNGGSTLDAAQESARELATELNAREGFNERDFVQLESLTTGEEGARTTSASYDNGTAENAIRYYSDGVDVSTDRGYAFMDEREYAYIRFTKYDSEAERYVTGTIDESYEAGADHADADLDGAVYSLYVDESNQFTVTYLEGTWSDGRLFWAQPLTSGGYRVIWDGDNNASNGFTDNGDNAYEDWTSACVSYYEENSFGKEAGKANGQLYFYKDYETANAYTTVTEKETTYQGIQHPDGMYGGKNHNGFYAVLTDQQVFVDADGADGVDGFADTWTLQDVTLENGAKVASAKIIDGELEFTGLYLGDYYICEEIRQVVSIYSTDNYDEESPENRWLSFAPGYTADVDDNGNPTKYKYSFTYTDGTTAVSKTSYTADQDYVHKETTKVSNQTVIKGLGIQISKTTDDNHKSGESENNIEEGLEGAGFTVFMVSELSKIKDGTIKPVLTLAQGDALVRSNDLVALYDNAGNYLGYKWAEDYLDKYEDEHGYGLFTEKYGVEVSDGVYEKDGTSYQLEQINSIVYVPEWGYYYTEDILDAYRDQYYTDENNEWDFSSETTAIARMYEDDESVIEAINKKYAYQDNHLNAGMACEWYGVNGISDGWVAATTTNGGYTGANADLQNKNLYILSEVFTNHYGHMNITDIPWGVYMVVETTTPDDVFTVNPLFVTISDSSATQNWAKSTTLKDNEIEEDLVIVKRDANSGQTVKQAGIRYRIWDYENEKYVDKYLVGEGGQLTMMSQKIFVSDESGRVDAVAQLEYGKYRIEEVEAPTGYHNTYWDYGDMNIGSTEYEDEQLGGEGKDADNYTEDNAVASMYGTVDFEVTTDRKYKSSGVSSSGDLEYLYIGEIYDNEEVQGKITIMKTGEVLVGYTSTDEIEYADEYTDVNDANYNELKSSVKERSIFNEMKDYYDLGTDEIDYRTITYDLTSAKIQKVDYIATDVNGVRLAAVYKDDDGNLVTMNGGKVTAYAKSGVAITPDGTETDMGSAQSIVITYDESEATYENASLVAVDNTYIYTVAGDKIASTAYLVTESSSGKLITDDYGVITRNGSKYTLTYTEAIYDPDIDYNYELTIDDKTTMKVRYVTYGTYLADDGTLVEKVSDGGYNVTTTDGETTYYESATCELTETNSGETFDFVYEERPLADATYQIIAAEDIYTQDGNGGTWFKEGDVVATVTTGEDGEIVSFTPNYKTAEDAGGGTYDYTYYYGNSNGTYTSLTGTKTYSADEFATTGSIENYWIESRMSDLDKALFEIPDYTDATIYPNTYYADESQKFYKRIFRASETKDPVVSDYAEHLEDEGKLSTTTSGVLTKTENGYALTYTGVDEYDGATLTENGDTYLLNLKDGRTIPVELSRTMYTITASYVSGYEAGDYVEKTAAGYYVSHTEDATSDSPLTNVDGSLPVFTETTYASATLVSTGSDTYTLKAADGTKLFELKADVYLTEFGGILEKTSDGYQVTTTLVEEMENNEYENAILAVHGATLIIGEDEIQLDYVNGQLQTAQGNTVTLSADNKVLTYTVNGTAQEYTAFNLIIEYDMTYSTKNDIIRVEKDGTLGTVSIYLPLGTYNIKEISAPYGFLIDDTIQTVELTAVDQIKEVVFNTADTSVDDTADTMAIWESKGLQWFLGGLNTLGEKYFDISDTDYWTWGTWGDAELPYFEDENGFINFYNIRVKAWATEKVPEKETKITVSKQDLTTLEELPGAELTVTDSTGKVVDQWTSTTERHEVTGLSDGTYTLTEVTAPDGYNTAESISFEVKDGVCTTGTVVMYDTPKTKSVKISKQDITTKKELPGANLVLTDKDGNIVEQWKSTNEAHEIKDLADGTYTLTEITAPSGYSKTESITFEVIDGVTKGGTVVMYDAPTGDKKTYISKQSFATKEELPGASLELTDADGNIVDKWTSTSEVHVIENLPDGTYTLTEVVAPNDYDKAESITFTTSNGEVNGGPVVMYDEYSPEENPRHPDSKQWNLGVGIYKTDKDTNESLAGAKFGLYTTDDIYNVDGKLLVEADTLLATATTDETGFANFAVDIALMSRYLDEDSKDDTLIYEKSVSYTYDSLTAGTEAGTYWLTVDGCDSVLLTKTGETYYTDGEHTLTIDTDKKTVSYMIEQSIDGNTTVNTGDYYIKELTPPDGYLLDDTIYDVDFEYVDQYTMYIPVYAKHANEETEVTLTKYDLTGTEEIEGATISVYKVNDVTDFDENGFLSHDDDNLTLIETWESTTEEHVVKGLLLSNDEYPRLANEEVRENIYVWREEIPAAGYSTASDIEFKIYQLFDENGDCLDENGEVYGYEVIINHIRSDQNYISGLISAPNDNADDWILTGQTENTWDYTTVLDGETLAKWILVNENLVFMMSDDITQETFDKVIRECDFDAYTFDTVYFENLSKDIEVKVFDGKVVSKRPADSYITYTQSWESIGELHDMVMYDETTKFKFSKQDIVTGEEVTGAQLEVWLLDEDGNDVRLVDSWTTGDDGFETEIDEETGEEVQIPNPHYIEKLTVGKTYELRETLAPTEDGYVKSNAVTFTVEDTGDIQHVIMEDDFTKVEFHKTDIETGKEVDGATLEIYRVDEKGNKVSEEPVETWTTGEDGYDEEGYPIAHIIDYLAVGDYILHESLAPTWNGYVTSQDVAFTVEETGILQQVEMVDDITKLDVYKIDPEELDADGNPVPDETGEGGYSTQIGGAVLEIYSLGTDFDLEAAEDAKEVVVSADDLAATITTVAGEPTRIERLPVGWYIMRETEAPEPYKVNPDPVIFEIVDTPEVQYVVMKDYQTVILKKEDKATGERLAGAEMAVYELPDYNRVATYDYTALTQVEGDETKFYLTLADGVDDSNLKSEDANGLLVTKVDDTHYTYGDFTLTLDLEAHTVSYVVQTKVTWDYLNTQTPFKTFTSESDKSFCFSDVTEKTYYAWVETKAPDGYEYSDYIYVFYVENVNEAQILEFFNTAIQHEDTPDTPTPVVGKLTLGINGGRWWNNVRTEDSGVYGSSIKLTVEGEATQTTTRSMWPMAIAGIACVAVAGVASGAVVIGRKKRKANAKNKEEQA